MVNEKKSVGVFRAGYIDADVGRVCRLLSLGRYYYSFEEATPLNLGDPDLEGYGYSDRVFLEVLQPYFEVYHLCVVLTSVPIEENYFTRDVKRKVIVCTSHQAEEFIGSTGRTSEEYFTLSACPELLSTEFQEFTGRPWTELFHHDLRGCLFDFQGVKSQVAAYLSKVSMCDRCRSLLSEANIDHRVIKFADTLLARIRRPTFGKALGISIMSPVLGFFYGGIVLGFLVNVVSSLALGGAPPVSNQRALLVGLLAAVVAFPVLVYGYLWIGYLVRTRRVAV